MALKYHYNKTTIQQYGKQLAIRGKALPILKNKETALRMEIKTLSKKVVELQKAKEEVTKKLASFQPFWEEFPHVVVLEKLALLNKKIVGVKVPDISELTFKMADISWWNCPAWVPSGVAILKHSVEVDVKLEVLEKQLNLLNAARKKTTQKVNLYEKVQIPEYAEAILKIKRFLEDKDNISKAAQKIVKKKKERRMAT